MFSPPTCAVTAYAVVVHGISVQAAHRPTATGQATSKVPAGGDRLCKFRTVVTAVRLCAPLVVRARTRRTVGT
jgi:hypothetical protein